MHPVEYHLMNKITWMSRQLRLKNEADSIKDWISAMQSVYLLLDNFTKSSRILNLTSLVDKKFSPRHSTISNREDRDRTVDPEINVEQPPAPMLKIARWAGKNDAESSTADPPRKKISKDGNGKTQTEGVQREAGV